MRKANGTSRTWIYLFGLACMSGLLIFSVVLYFVLFTEDNKSTSVYRIRMDMYIGHLVRHITQNRSLVSSGEKPHSKKKHEDYRCKSTPNGYVLTKVIGPTAIYNSSHNTTFKSNLRSRERPSYTAIFNETFTNNPKLSRRLSLKDHKKYMTLVKDFVAILDQNEIEYIMAYGTLLGSFMFHDMIPWDDDVDLSINVCDINRVRQIFSKKEFQAKFGVSGLHDPYNTHGRGNLGYLVDLNNPSKCVGKIPPQKTKSKQLKCFYKGKFFSKSSPDAFAKKGLPWRYPFVDFNFYINDGNKITTMDALKNPVFDSSTFYPLHLRPLHDMWLPSVHNSVKYLKAKFKSFRCQQGPWDHATETGKPGSRRRPVNCSEVRNMYPYVERHPVNSSNPAQGTQEKLILKNKALYTVIVNETFSSENMFNLA